MHYRSAIKTCVAILLHKLRNEPLSARKLRKHRERGHRRSLRLLVGTP